MRWLPLAILGVAVLLAPAIWFGMSLLLPSETGGGSARDSQARIEVEALRVNIDDLRTRIGSLEGEVANR